MKNKSSTVICLLALLCLALIVCSVLLKLELDEHRENALTYADLVSSYGEGTPHPDYSGVGLAYSWSLGEGALFVTFLDDGGTPTYVTSISVVEER